MSSPQPAKRAKRTKDLSTEESDSSGSSSSKTCAENNEEILWLEIEGCEPEASDLSGIQQLIQTVLPTDHGIALENLAGYLIENGSSNVVKQEEDAGVLSVVGLLALNADSQRTVIDQLIQFLKHQGDEVKDILSNDHAWLLVKARAVQIPAGVAIPQLTAMQQEILSINSNTASSLERYILLTKKWKVNGEVVFAFAEDAIVEKHSILTLKLTTPGEIDFSMETEHWLYAFDAMKMPVIIEEIKAAFGHFVQSG